MIIMAAVATVAINFSDPKRNRPREHLETRTVGELIEEAHNIVKDFLDTDVEIKQIAARVQRDPRLLQFLERQLLELDNIDKRMRASAHTLDPHANLHAVTITKMQSTFIHMTLQDYFAHSSRTVETRLEDLVRSFDSTAPPFDHTLAKFMIVQTSLQLMATAIKLAR